VKNVILYLVCFSAIIFALFACNKTPSFQILSGDKIALNSEICVFVFLNTECPICQKYQGTFKSMALDSAQVYYVFPGLQSKEMIKEMCDFDSISFNRVILDSDYRLTKQLKANTTPEAIIRKDNKTYYSGLIDDRFTSIGTSKSSASINYIENALNSLHKNEAIKIPYTKAVGCFIEPN
jgi:protein-disulfide isomerase